MSVPTRLCNEGGCNEVASYRGRCQYHANVNDRRIARADRQLYQTKRWAMTRKRKLHLDPLCNRCGEIATDVHHIHGVGNANPFDLSTLEALCHPCHSRQTRADQVAA